MSNQIQCPNCGGYEIQATDTTGCLGITFRIIGFCFFFIPGLLIENAQNDRDWKEFWKGSNTATCQTCKYKFYKHQIPRRPIQANKNLIELGHQKNEDEKRNAALAASIYYQKHKRK